MVDASSRHIYENPLEPVNKEFTVKQYFLYSICALFLYNFILPLINERSLSSLPQLIILSLQSAALSLTPAGAFYNPIFYTFFFFLIINGLVAYKLKKLWPAQIVLWLILGICFVFIYYQAITTVCVGFGCLGVTWAASLLFAYFSVSVGLVGVFLTKFNVSSWKIILLFSTLVFIIATFLIFWINSFSVNTPKASQKRDRDVRQQESLPKVKEALTRFGGYYYEPQYLPKNIDKETRLVIAPSGLGPTLFTKWSCINSNSVGGQLAITQNDSGFTSGGVQRSYDQYKHFKTKEVAVPVLKYEELGTAVGVRAYYTQHQNANNSHSLVFEMDDPDNVTTKKRFFDMGVDNECFGENTKSELIKIANSLKKTLLVQ